MPRKVLNFKDLRKSDVVEEVANEPASSQRFSRRNRPKQNYGETSTGEDDENAFYNICPCNACALKGKPTVRSSSTIERHIEKYGESLRYKVNPLS